MSSLPTSSVSSVRRERRYVRGTSEDRRRGIREPRTTNKRFQRLEAHVVTLARSVAHLSSEMRTQHLVIQEIESVRQEVAALRAQTNMLNIRWLKLGYSLSRISHCFVLKISVHTKTSYELGITISG